MLCSSTALRFFELCHGAPAVPHLLSDVSTLRPQRLVVEPELDNPRDANALLVMDSG